MNDLKAIYNKLLEFGDNHNMVNQTLFLMTEDELEHLDIDFRCIIFIVSTSNIGRDLNSPTYGIDFEIMVMDKTDRFDNLRTFESVQENIFVIGFPCISKFLAASFTIITLNTAVFIIFSTNISFIFAFPF